MTSQVVIYSTGYCPFCTRAKELLDHLKIAYEEIRVDDNSSLREEMERLSGRRTVPQIFFGERHIGGFDDLKKLYDSGELNKILTGEK